MQYRYFLPIALFVGTVAILYSGLWNNPEELPSAMIGKHVPDFDLAPIPGLEGKTPGLTSAELKGRPVLVNFFASWCIPCKAEHPLLLRLKESGVAPIYGINYKDKPEDALHWLNELGNPYNAIGDDREGRVAIDWGVYGVPETYVVDASGKILYRYAGPLTSSDLEKTILPLLKGGKK